MEGLTFHDEPSGYIMAPNGAYWQHHGTYDMDSLTQAQAQGEVSHAAGFDGRGLCRSVDSHTGALAASVQRRRRGRLLPG